MLPEIRSRREGDLDLPVLVWRWPAPMRTVASGPHGGGLGLRSWVLNAQVPPSYSRRDPESHLAKLAQSLGLSAPGVGMLTSAQVGAYLVSSDDGVEVFATVGLGQPIFAAAPEQARAVTTLAGTVNVVAVIPSKLSDAALVNAVGTATEAKVQALSDAGIPATGTATDAVCIACPDEGSPEPFGGPRSRWGACLARAVHGAVLAGACDT